jgi:hypothetical protein
MTRINRFSISTVFLIITLCFSLLNVQPAFADDTTPPADVPVEETEEALPTEEMEQDEQEDEAVDETVTSLLSEVPEDTSVVVLDDEGEVVPLATQEAVEIVQSAAPIWCPEGVTPPIVAGTQGCTTDFPSINDLLANMNAEDAEWVTNYAQNGVIYLVETTGQDTAIKSPVSIDSQTYANIFNTISAYNLTIQGGWDKASGTITGQTMFLGPDGYLRIGDSDNPWLGSVTINNITMFDIISGSPSLEVHSGETVNLNDVTVLGSGAGQDGISISAANANLDNVRAEWAGDDGISITATEEGGTVTLNNVVAKNNKGSGIFIDGSDTLVNVFGGSFVNNARFGIEANNSVSTSIPLANAWTDQDDYSPGSVVTLSGNNNSLNGSMLGYIPGETVQVNVWGPNGYAASCEGIAGELGEWKCQITLWDSELAVGEYFYIATGLISGVSISGGFTDGRTVDSVTVNGVGSITVAPGDTITIGITVITSNQPAGSGSQWWSTQYRISTTDEGLMTCEDTTNFNPAGTHTTSFNVTAPLIPGTYNVYIIAFSNNNDCSAGGSDMFTLENAITVQAAPPTDTTPPVITPNISGTLGNNGWYTSDVTVSWTVVDPESAITSSTGCGSTTINSDTAGVTLTCEATSEGGTNSESVTIKRDTTPPTIAAQSDINVVTTDPAGIPVVYTSPATNDNMDGAGTASCLPASGDFFSVGATLVTCSASDDAGNNATDVTFNVNVTYSPTDTTPPVITPNISGTLGSNGWYTSDVTVTWTVVDPDSAITSSTGCGSTTIDSDTAGITLTCEATSEGGTNSESVTIKRDTTPPTIAAQSDINVVTADPTGIPVVYASPATNDNMDGAGTASCSPASGDPFPVGATLVTCSAVDSAGNSATDVTFNINVIYSPSGGGGDNGSGDTGGGGVIVSPDGTTSTTSSAFVPVTGGPSFNIVCPPSSYRREFTTFNLLFNNMCDGYRGMVEFLTNVSLPSAIPSGQKLLNGFQLIVLQNGEELETLSGSANITIEFIVPDGQSTSDLVILFWDGEEWIEVEDAKLNGNIFQATVTKLGFYVLVTK